MLRSLFPRLKSGTEYLNYGRDIIQDWGADRYETASRDVFRVLDLGCGHGADLKNIREEIENRGKQSASTPEVQLPAKPEVQLPAKPEVQLHGIESYPPYVAECREANIQTHALNIERDSYPGQDASYDLIVANQILEHTKEIFWIFAEVARLLVPGGHFIVGVPNLASAHNRLLLFFGQQPTQIKSMSAHVRGFTKPDMREFAETGGLFRLIAFRGSNFYPLPPVLSKPLARALPTFAWASFYLLERTNATGDFLDCLSGDDNFLETPFYGSPQNPPRRGRNSRKGSNTRTPGAKTIPKTPRKKQSHKKKARTAARR